MEILGVSLRTLQPPRADQRPPAETALEEFHRLVACGVLVARAARRCFLWRNEGLGGVVTQHCYLDMLQSLAEVLTPVCQGDAKNMEFIEQRQTSGGGGGGGAGGTVNSLSHQSLLQLSVIWARVAFTDLVHSILTLLSETLDRQRHDHSVQSIASAPISHGVMLPFVIFMSHYLKTMFGDTAAKPKQEKVSSLGRISMCSLPLAIYLIPVLITLCFPCRTAAKADHPPPHAAKSLSNDEISLHGQLVDAAFGDTWW